MNKPLDSIVCSLEIHKDIQKRVINEYKEKVIRWMNWAMAEGRSNRECELMYKIENGDFD